MLTILLALCSVAQAAVTITPSQNQGNVIVDLGDGKPAHRAFPQLYYNDADQLVLGRIASNSSVATEEKQQEIIDRIEDILAEEATEAKQDTMIARLQAILDEEATEAKQDTQITHQLTQIARLDSILAEEATEAKQDAGNASLASLDSKASTLITQTDTLEALLAAGNASTASIDSKASTLISQTDGIEASLSSIDLDTSTLITQTDGIEGNQATQITNQGTQITEVQTSNTRLGSLSETAPASDTASSGLNGRLQRIAQNLTSNTAALVARLGTLGQSTMTGSTPVVIASDQSDVPVSGMDYLGGRRRLLTDLSGIQIVQNTALIAVERGMAFQITTGMQALGATAEKPFFYISNPSGSGKILKLLGITYSSSVGNNTTATWRAYINPTVTVAGSTLTPLGNRQVGQAASVAVFQLNPTASANGSLASVRRTVSSANELVIEVNGALWLDPGNRALFTVEPSANNLTGYINAVFVEN